MKALATIIAIDALVLTLAFFQSEAAGLAPQLLQALGLIITAVATYYASTYKARRENAAMQDRQTETLVSGYSKMTDQAQAIIARMQAETVEAMARANEATTRAKTLEQELREVRLKYEAATTELEMLRKRAQERSKRGLK